VFQPTCTDWSDTNWNSQVSFGSTHRLVWDLVSNGFRDLGHFGMMVVLAETAPVLRPGTFRINRVVVSHEITTGSITARHVTRRLKVQ